MRESSTWYSLHILDLHSDQVTCHPPSTPVIRKIPLCKGCSYHGGSMGSRGKSPGFEPTYVANTQSFIDL